MNDDGDEQQTGNGASNEGQAANGASDEGQGDDSASNERQGGNGASNEGQASNGGSSEGQAGNGGSSEGQAGNGGGGEGQTSRSGGDRFDKFTERARKVLTLAQEEATRFNHNYIGTEHLLLGLVREGEGVAAKVLGNLGVELDRVRGAVEFIIGRGDRMIVGEIGLTPRAKKVIELAVDEARRLGHHYIGTEHLLLGLVREGEGIAAGVLESLGVNLEKVRKETIGVLSQSNSPHSETSGDTTATAARTVWLYLVLEVAYLPDARSGVVVDADREEYGRFVADGVPLREALRVVGEDGWELVAVDTHPQRDDTRGHSYVLKRPV